MIREFEAQLVVVPDSEVLTNIPIIISIAKRASQVAQHSEQEVVLIIIIITMGVSALTSVIAVIIQQPYFFQAMEQIDTLPIVQDQQKTPSHYD